MEGASRPADRDRDGARARSCGPGAIPSTCAATSSSPASKVLLRALDVPAGQFVELRTVIPRTAFSSTAGMRVVAGNGRAEDRRARRQPTRRRSRRTRHASTTRSAHPWRYALYLLLLGTIPAFLIVAGGLLVLRPRAPKTGYDREYEQEPPTDTAPALVPTLLRQGGEAGSFEFTATLFDLIRRGVFTSTPVTTERTTWGGLRSENVSDLELAAGQGGREADAVGERRRPRRRGRDRRTARSGSRTSASGSRTTGRR